LQSSGTPAADSLHGLPQGELRLPAWPRASPFFCGDIFQHGVVQHRLGQQFLRFGVLLLKRLQLAGLRSTWMRDGAHQHALTMMLGMLVAIGGVASKLSRNSQSQLRVTNLEFFPDAAIAIFCAVDIIQI
jgi:hypothetical protein